MVEKTGDDFFDGLVHEDRFPVVWAYVETVPSDAQKIVVNEANEQLLRLINTLSEKTAEVSDDGSEYSAEFARLDLKLNVLLELAGQLIREQLQLPAEELVRLGHTGLEWWSSRAPEAGRDVVVKVYLDRELPRPLQFMGRALVDKASFSADGPTPVRIRYAGMAQSLEDELEKFIFRHHRKKIALAKNPG